MSCDGCNEIDISSCGPYASRRDVIRTFNDICNNFSGQSDCIKIADVDSETNFCDTTIENMAWPEGVPSVDCCEILTVYAQDGSCFWAKINGYAGCWIRHCGQISDCFVVVPDGTDTTDFYTVGFPAGCNSECDIVGVTWANSRAQWLARACSSEWQLVTNLDCNKTLPPGTDPSLFYATFTTEGALFCEVLTVQYSDDSQIFWSYDGGTTWIPLISQCFAETQTTTSITDYCDLFNATQKTYCDGLTVVVYDGANASHTCHFNNDGSDCVAANNWACGATGSILSCVDVENCPGVFTDCADITTCLNIESCIDVEACPNLIHNCSEVQGCLSIIDCADVQGCLSIIDCFDVEACQNVHTNCGDVEACFYDGYAIWGDNTGSPFSQNYVVDTTIDANLGLTNGTFGTPSVIIDPANGEIEFLEIGYYCISASFQARMEAGSCVNFDDTRIDFAFNGPNDSYAYHTAIYDNDTGSDLNSIISISTCFYVNTPGTIGTFTLAGGGPALTTCAIEGHIQRWSVVRVI